MSLRSARSVGAEMISVRLSASLHAVRRASRRVPPDLVLVVRGAVAVAGAETGGLVLIRVIQSTLRWEDFAASDCEHHGKGGRVAADLVGAAW